MAAPLAIPLLAKVGALAKGLTGIGAKAVGPKLGSELLGQNVRRFAGQGLQGLVGKDMLTNKGELALRLAPDVLFGGMTALSTPGDIVDKVVAGSTQALGGGLVGLNAARGTRALFKDINPRVLDLVDLGGSLAGDVVGMSVGDQLMRLKGGGMTPYERQSAEADQQYRAAIEEEIRRRLLLEQQGSMYI